MSSPFLKTGVGKLARLRMRAGERAAHFLASPTLDLSAHGIQDEATAVALSTVDLFDEFRGQGDRDSGGWHSMIIL
jgi:hypothetical protein